MFFMLQNMYALINFSERKSDKIFRIPIAGNVFEKKIV